MPNHARNVNLVLNLITGLVSPQFHCRFDDFFETIRLSSEDVVTAAPWHVLAGFKRADGSKVESNVDVAVGNREQPVVTIDSVQPPHDFNDPFDGSCFQSKPCTGL